jgi:hypothetical protein
MKIKFALIPIAAAIAITAAPALAKSKTHHKAHHRTHQSTNVVPHVQAPDASALIGRNVSDPSFGNRVGYDRAKSSGRCVADLGYGRYEYCGW